MSENEQNKYSVVIESDVPVVGTGYNKNILRYFNLYYDGKKVENCEHQVYPYDTKFTFSHERKDGENTTKVYFLMKYSGNQSMISFTINHPSKRQGGRGKRNIINEILKKYV